MLEVVREHVAREGGGVPDDEAVAGAAPGDDPVQLRFTDQVVRLGQERRQLRPLQQRLQRPRRRTRGRDQVVVVVQRDVVGPRRRRQVLQQRLHLELGLKQGRGVHGGGGWVVGAGVRVVHEMRRAGWPRGGEREWAVWGEGGAGFIGFGRSETGILVTATDAPRWRWRGSRAVEIVPGAENSTP